MLSLSITFYLKVNCPPTRRPSTCASNLDQFRWNWTDLFEITLLSIAQILQQLSMKKNQTKNQFSTNTYHTNTYTPSISIRFWNAMLNWYCWNGIDRTVCYLHATFMDIRCAISNKIKSTNRYSIWMSYTFIVNTKTDLLRTSNQYEEISL